MNYKSEQWHRHLGVYGVCVNSNPELLVILKKGGPYDGLFDLPGGSFENPESISECLHREILEETGMYIHINKGIGSFDVLTNSPYNGYNFTHHIALVYSISVDTEENMPIENYVDDGKVENDSLGYQWVNMSMLTEKNSSPLVKKVKELVNNQHNFEIIKFFS